MRQVLLALITIIAVASLAAVGSYAHFSDTETSPDNVLETGSLDLQLGDWNEGFTDDPLYDSVTQTWYYGGSYPPGMSPGDSLEAAVYLTNVGDSAGDHLDIYCVIVNTELDDYDVYPSEHDAEQAKVGGRDDDDDGLVDEDPLDGADNDGDGLIDEDLGYGDVVPLEPGYGIFDKDKVMIINYMKYQNAGAIDIVWNDGTEWDPTYMADVDGDGKITLYDFKKHPVPNLPPPVGGFANLSMKVTFDINAGDEYQGDQTQMTLIFNLL